MDKAQHEHDPRTDPPGAVSDQNREEAQSEHRDDQTHPEPRTRGRGQHQTEPSSDDAGDEAEQ